MPKRKERSDSDTFPLDRAVSTVMEPRDGTSTDATLVKAKSDMSALLRVSHRLALVDTSVKLMAVLEKLLPRLLHRMGENHELLLASEENGTTALTAVYSQMHTTLVEILSHAMKRVKDDATVQLPCDAIVHLLESHDSVTATVPCSNLARVDAFTLNLSLAFLAVGIPRLSDVGTLESLLPSLLVLHCDCRHRLFLTASSPMQYSQTKHLLIVTLERLVATSLVLDKVVVSGSAVAHGTLLPSQTLLAATARIDANDTASTLPTTRTRLDMVRCVVHSRPDVAAALYDVLLDVLLYQPPVGTTSGVPPAGVSQSGVESLPSWLGHDRGRLVALKCAVLDVIAPHKRYALWAPPPLYATDDTAAARSTLHRSRMVALLVAASGDVVVTVSEKGTAFLKQHLDTMRGVVGSSDGSESLGSTMVLASELLALCLGQVHAEAMVSPVPACLGMECRDTSATRQQVLSTKRRPVDESTVGTAMLSFVALKILTDHPLLLDESDPSTVVTVIGLALQTCHKSLSSSGGTSGTLTKLRAKPYLASAELLSAVAIRLSTYDAVAAQQSSVHELLARCVATACTVLKALASSASPSQRVAVGSNDGSVAVRDLCYGVVATVARSSLAVSPAMVLFHCGTAVPTLESSHMATSSVETAALLFQCTAMEEERLRPRAVAALDSLLAAYCRVYATSVVEPTEVSESIQPDTSNPWLAAGASKKTSPQEKPVDRIGLAKSLLPLLWNAAQQYQPKSSRVASARWSSDLLKHIDIVGGYHLLCFLAGDPDVTSASIAREGLGLPKQSEMNVETIGVTTSSSIGTLPDFGILVDRIFPKSRSQTMDRQLLYWDFSIKGKAATLRCVLSCLLNDLYGGEDSAVAKYLSVVIETLREIPTDTTLSAGDASTQGATFVDLLDECAACLLAILTASPFARSQVAMDASDKPFACRLNEVEALALKANSSRARRFFAGACGKVMELALGDHQTVDSFFTWISQSNVARSLSACAKSLSDLEQHSAALGVLHGSSFLGAHLVRAFRLRVADIELLAIPIALNEIWDCIGTIVSLLGKGVLHKDDAVANACADCLAIALSYDSDDAPLLQERLYNASSSALTCLATGIGKFGHSDTVNPARAIKIARATGACLAATTPGNNLSIDSEKGERNLGLSRSSCVDALFELLGSMASRKEEEIDIVAGEALAAFADAYSPKNVKWSYSGEEWPAAFDESFGKQLPPHEQVLYVLLRSTFAASSPQKRTACAPALLAVVARGARRVNMDAGASHRCLIQSLVTHLMEAQKVFLSLLRDPKSKQFYRESSSLGLAACRSLVNGNYGTELSVEEFNHKILRAFGQTTNFGTSAMMETSAQAAERRAAQGTSSTVETSLIVESEVGGASGIGEAALGAYREMAAASVSLERHDVLYALFFLSVSHAYWLSPDAGIRYSASSLLGDSFMGNNSAVAMRKALRPHLGKVLPRILRACHDPNKQTRDQMSALWTGMTGGGAEGRQAISKHLLSTIDTLLEDTASKLWRARVGAFGALSEVIVLCTWSTLGGRGAILQDDELIGKVSMSAGIRVLRIWNAVIRALDDVQGAVRDCGEKFARAVRALTIRLCDPTVDLKSDGTKLDRDEIAKHEREATAAAATSIRWLIHRGLNRPEATGVCMSTLVEVVDIVRPAILEPSLPTLIRSLLLSISALEPSAFNKLQLRTENQEGLERARLQLAQTGPLAAALTKCVELIPSVKIRTQQLVAPELDAALRQSSGFATRAATADTVSTLCRTCPTVFQFSGPNATNPSVHLFRAFYTASEQERGEAAKDKMIHALGNLASLCPASSVRSLALRACNRYIASSGNYFDSASRRAAAAAVRAIAVRASNHFADGGVGDIWATRVLPVAYLGRKDTDSKVASLWQVVWDEGGSATSLSVSSTSMNSFGTTFEEKLLPSLVKECVLAIQDVSWSRRVAASQALVDLVNIGVLAPSPRSTQAATKLDASAILRARFRAEASALSLSECVRLLTKPRLWNGKVDMMKAAAQIASKWIAAESSAESEAVLYGWTEAGEPCPYRPCILRQVNLNSLFEDDDWFMRSAIENESVVEDIPGTPIPTIESTTAHCDSTAINFDELESGDDAVESNHDSRLDLPSSAGLTFTGLCRFFMDQAIPTQKNAPSSKNEELLPYRTNAFRCFRDVVNSLPTECSEERIRLWKCLSPSLLEFFGTDSREKEIDKRESPVLIAGSIQCFESLLWDGLGAQPDCTAHVDPHELTLILNEAGGSRQPAWTVREAAAQCMSHIALKCSDDSIRRPVLVMQLIDSAKTALSDRKFWRVRLAGLKILENLVKRVGTTGTKKLMNFQLNLEALLPHKETVLRLVRSCLTDSESSVMSSSSSIVNSMSWWP